MYNREKKTWNKLKPLGFTYFIVTQNNYRRPYVYYAKHPNLIGHWDLDQNLDDSHIRSLKHEIQQVLISMYGRQETIPFQ
jgi:hypothetical protein